MRPFKIRHYRDSTFRTTRHRILRSWLKATVCGETHPLVVDWGCGAGTATGEMREEFPAWRFYMTDVVEHREQALDVDFSRIDTDIPRLPLGDESVDAIVCSEVFEHVHCLTATVREIHRLLKPGGVLVGSIPNFRHLAARMSFLKKGSYRLGGQFENGGHINFITPEFLTHFVAPLFTLEMHGGDEDWLSWVDFVGGRWSRKAYRTLNFRGLSRVNRRYNALSYDYLFLYRKKAVR